MSKIRSHLDAIMTPGDGRESQATHVIPPRPAYPRSAAGHQPGYAQPQPAPNLQDIHKSLDQLANRISAASRSNAPAPVSASGPSLHEVRQEIHNGISQARQELGRSLDHDLKRIAAGIAALQSSQQMHPDYVDRMQAELQNLNNSIGQIAEMQALPPASQVDLTGVSQSIESGYSEIVQKLDQVLAQRGDEMPVPPEVAIPDYSSDLKSLSDRVEEMARTLVAMSVSAGDIEEHHALERIEARLASLAKVIETDPASTGAQHGDQMFADMASHQETVAAELARLSAQLELLQAGGSSVQLPDQSADFGSSFAGLESRIANLADRLDGLAVGGLDNPNTSGQEILSVLQDLVGRVTAIEQIAARASQDGNAATPESSVAADRFAGLEAQLSAITAQLGTTAVDPETGEPQPPLPGSIANRLENLEAQIAASRDIVVDMASQAVADGSEGGTAGLSAMQVSQFDEVLAELRQMRELGATQAHNGEDLEVIAQAIQSISARLDQMEGEHVRPASGLAGEPATGGEIGVPEVMAIGETTQPRETIQTFEELQQAEAAQSAELHDPAGLAGHELPHVHDAPPLAPENDPQGNTAPVMPEPAEMEPAYAAEMQTRAAETEMQAVEAEDVPLEPGSGMPDLESLVRRATNRKRAKNEPASEDAPEDDGINDLMAAARRAAQAASAQAQSQRDREAMDAGKTGKRKGFSIGKPSIFSRKALLASVAVVALAVAGWTIVPKFLGGSNEPEVSQLLQDEKPAGADEVLRDTPAMAGNETSDTAEAEVADETTAVDAGKPAPELAQDAGDEPAVMFEPEETVTGAMAANDGDAGIVLEGLPQEIGNAALLQDATAGDGNALFEIARRYTEGDGADRNLETAATWYQQAASLGHGPSQYRLGNFYEKGHGVTADIGEAASWYSKAAAAGNALAMHNLAVLNVQGLLGSDPDMETAIGWFEKAANLGVKDSQVNLGILYTRGMGVKADLEQAYKWFAIAAKGGDNDAAAKRDTVAKNMRPEQLEKARGEAEIWKPKTLDRKANTVSLKESWKTGSKLERAKLSQTEMVRRAQAMLTRLGFDAGPADGIMGAKTEQAIRDYQQKFGLPVDGRVSSALLEALSAQAV